MQVQRALTLSSEGIKANATFQGSRPRAINSTCFTVPCGAAAWSHRSNLMAALCKCLLRLMCCRGAVDLPCFNWTALYVKFIPLIRPERHMRQAMNIIGITHKHSFECKKHFQRLRTTLYPCSMLQMQQSVTSTETLWAILAK